MRSVSFFRTPRCTASARTPRIRRTASWTIQVSPPEKTQVAEQECKFVHDVLSYVLTALLQARKVISKGVLLISTRHSETRILSMG
jgi:hypothetical protein